MKLFNFYNKNYLIVILLLFSYIEVVAATTIDDKVKKLTLELRCMTCQNQSIFDSEAEFSNDIKKIVRAKFEEGNTELEIKEFLVSRYGEYILFRPLFNYKNLFLWAFPFILLIFGIFFVLYKTIKK